LADIIRIGTRGSELALWQANYLQAELEKIGQSTSIHVIKTQGDRVQDLGFDKLEGKGFFTKEIEEALLAELVDLAVHSMKDLPTTAPDGLVTTAVSYRENPADWLLLRQDRREEGALLQLPAGAVVGTSSARRKAQLLDLRSDLQLRDIRGNVPTRVDKLRRGDFDAIMLAGAGIARLALYVSDLHLIKLNPKEFVPAPAQGVLAYQVRQADKPLRRILQQIHHPAVAACTNVERKVLRLLEGGCHMPLGVYCEKDPIGNYHVWAALADTWSSPLKRVRLSSSTHFELADQTVAALKG
jgi:hydroxymethylbilane synthase